MIKQQPLGVCDLCGGEIPPHLGPYTSKGKPRLYCSRDCRNTANSRAGASVRAKKARRRVEAGTWQNPADLNPPNPERVGLGVKRARRAEVKAGTWRNPALTDEARDKLSRPRKHGDNPALHSALERLRQGYSVVDLEPEEREAHRVYRKQLREARRDEVNAYYRRRYHERQATMTDDEREAQRARWREVNRKRKNK